MFGIGDNGECLPVLVLKKDYCLDLCFYRKIYAYITLLAPLNCILDYRRYTGNGNRERNKFNDIWVPGTRHVLILLSISYLVARSLDLPLAYFPLMLLHSNVPCARLEWKITVFRLCLILTCYGVLGTPCSFFVVLLVG